MAQRLSSSSSRYEEAPGLPVRPVVRPKAESTARPCLSRDWAASPEAAATSSAQGDPTLNTRYQRALDLPEGTRAEALRKYRELSSVAADFLDVASRYAMVIVDEAVLPERERTLQPVVFPGSLAGGLKFVVAGILFKYASDVATDGDRYLYGRGAPDPEAAAKAAGHELRCAVTYSSVLSRCGSRTRWPLETVIDYKGRRLLASALLPVDGDRTLVYGSGDGGRTARSVCQPLADDMRLAAARLHLAPHQVAGVTLYSAGDVEGHAGLDGRNYLLDLARALPPESATECPHLPGAGHAVLTRMLRPELLGRLREAGIPALSPDALTAWGAGDPQAREHFEAVGRATRHLLDVVVPELAATLAEREAAGADVPDPFWELHARGVNARHLGLLRSLLPPGRCPRARARLLAEMVARTLKNLLRAALRGDIQLLGGSRERNTPSVLRSKLVVFLGLVSGSHPLAADFLRASVVPSLSRRFGRAALEPGEETDGAARGLASLLRADELGRVLLRVCDTGGIVLAGSCREAVLRSPVGFVFASADVEAVVARVKAHPLVSYAHARVLWEEARSPHLGAGACRRLLDMALREFEQALRSPLPEGVWRAEWERVCLVREAHALEEAGQFREADDRLLGALAGCLDRGDWDGVSQFGSALATRWAAAASLSSSSSSSSHVPASSSSPPPSVAAAATAAALPPGPVCRDGGGVMSVFRLTTLLDGALSRLGEQLVTSAALSAVVDAFEPALFLVPFPRGHPTDEWASVHRVLSRLVCGLVEQRSLRVAARLLAGWRLLALADRSGGCGPGVAAQSSSLPARATALALRRSRSEIGSSVQAFDAPQPRSSSEQVVPTTKDPDFFASSSEWMLSVSSSRPGAVSVIVGAEKRFRVEFAESFPPSLVRELQASVCQVEPASIHRSQEGGEGGVAALAELNHELGAFVQMVQSVDFLYLGARALDLAR